MSRFLKKLKENKFSLIMSLPKNDIELAMAAFDGGADALKVHVNVEHRASGTYFGPFEEEKETLKTIVNSVNIPVGIVPGASKVASRSEMTELFNMGIDFFDIYIENIPSYMLELPKEMGRMFAASCHFDFKLLPFINNWGNDMLEASVMSPEHYGRELRLSDLLLYEWLCKNSSSPVIIPTQLAINPEEVYLLHKAGVKSIMIGAIVTGKDGDSIYNATKKFREFIDKL